jgi:hypothetical protein
VEGDPQKSVEMMEEELMESRVAFSATAAFKAAIGRRSTTCLDTTTHYYLTSSHHWHCLFPSSS